MNKNDLIQIIRIFLNPGCILGNCVTFLIGPREDCSLIVVEEEEDVSAVELIVNINGKMNSSCSITTFLDSS